MTKKKIHKNKTTKSNSVKVATKSQPKLPSSFSLLKGSSRFIYEHKKKLSGVVAVPLVLYLLIVRLGSSFDPSLTSELISQQLGDNELLNNAVLAGVIIGSGGGLQAGANSLIITPLLIMGSLAIIWALRRLVAKKDFHIRDAYYSGMYPLIPFVLIVLLMTAQFIPFAIGGFLYSIADANELIGSLLERGVFIAIWIGLSLLSAYWLANSLMAMYAVTLPDIYPLQALRATKAIIKGRRWLVFRKIFLLALGLLTVFGLTLLLAIFVVPAVAVFVYDALVILALLFGHVYMYKLYRSLV